MENINKSIIYGNIHQNRYGKFLPICSSINDRSNYPSIQTMSLPSWITYIKVPISKNTTESLTPTEFKKSPSFSSPKRKTSKLNTMKTVIVTKLFKVLEKSCYTFWKNLVFSFHYFLDVKNVFIGCLIQQFNPLLPFETTNYRAIV